MTDSPFTILIIGAQIFCIYHVIKHHKPWWWILLIVVVPLLGCIWYFFREVKGQPGGRVHRKLVDLNPGKIRVSKHLINQLEQQRDVTDTVDIRLKLAEAHVEMGNHDDAIGYYNSCLTGYHKDDPVILFGLARSLFAIGNYSESRKYLSQLNKTGRIDYKNERVLLEARIRAELNEIDEANRLFEQACNLLPGEEARCHYAQFLQVTGNLTKAMELFERILHNAERGDNAYRNRNQEWIAIAQQEIKG